MQLSPMSCIPMHGGPMPVYGIAALGGGGGGPSEVPRWPGGARRGTRPVGPAPKRPIVDPSTEAQEAPSPRVPPAASCPYGDPCCDRVQEAPPRRLQE